MPPRDAKQADDAQQETLLTLTSTKGMAIVGGAAFLALVLAYALTSVFFVEPDDSELDAVTRARAIGQVLQVDDIQSIKVTGEGRDRDNREVRVNLTIEAGRAPGAGEAATFELIKRHEAGVRSLIIANLDEYTYEEVEQSNFVEHLENDIRARLNERYGRGAVKNVWVQKLDR